MQTLRYSISKSRRLFYQNSITQYSFYSSSSSLSLYHDSNEPIEAKDVVVSFKNWFYSQKNQVAHQVFDVLREGKKIESLDELKLNLSEEVVLSVLNHRCASGKKDVLACLEFFEWAGKQPRFMHTRVTFAAIFKILATQKPMLLMNRFLDSLVKDHSSKSNARNVRFQNVLVMGYAVAGKPELALQIFGKMRFQGIDLDCFAYHVLLNALVEQKWFDAVDLIAKQIGVRGFENEVTCSIMMKSFCKRGMLDGAEEYLKRVVRNRGQVDGYSVGVLIDALCKGHKFEKAAELLDEFRGLGMVRAECAYGIWIRDLVQAGRLEGALKFLKSKKDVEAYVPDVFRYNTLIYSLLRENRLEEVYDLLVEMKEGSICPDEVTMNAVLCFFCKAGMVEGALELFDSRSEFGLTPNSMAYNYLINTLCGDGSVDEAYRVLKNSIHQGYFPGTKTFSIFADALCREGKLEKMMELVGVALERNFLPSKSTFDKFISALCRVKRVEDGYLIHGQLLHRFNRVSSETTYCHLISGFTKSHRGDIAARLLIEMQEKGYITNRKLYTMVIRCLCEMENPEKQFFRLLEMQLPQPPGRDIYNYFINGAGLAGKSELAKGVYEMMVRSGIQPNLSSDIFLLKSYLRSKKISEALNFFNDSSERRRIGRKMYNAMIVGLCKAERPDIALDILRQMRENNVTPSLECYEELVKVLCTNRKYSMVIKVLDDLDDVGRKFSSFLCNTLLMHSLYSRDLYCAWVNSRDKNIETSCEMLDQLILAFSSWRSNHDVLELEEVFEELFPPTIFTYNMLLKRLSMEDMDRASEYFRRLCQKGYEPNRWTYDILVHGFLKHDRTVEAQRWMDQMFRRGFELTDYTKQFM